MSGVIRDGAEKVSAGHIGKPESVVIVHLLKFQKQEVDICIKPSSYLDDKFFDEFGTFQQLKSQDIYKLRCSFLHSGDLDISNNTIDRFDLVKPSRLGVGPKGEVYGYRYKGMIMPTGFRSAFAGSLHGEKVTRWAFFR